MTKLEYMECHDEWDDGEPIRVPYFPDEETEEDEPYVPWGF